MKFKLQLQQMQKIVTKEQLKKKEQIKGSVIYSSIYVYIYIFSGMRACKLNGSEMQIQRVSDFIR